jgi:cyclophilin family peptidyl-prolyl cis-trans isomerase
VAFPEKGSYIWTLETSEGTMTFTLDHQHAPEHVRNILYLSELGFYDGLTFHRIIPGFMAQGGCPFGRGNGNPGYGLTLEANKEAKHEGAGVLSMARSALPDSAGSQFFITFASQPRLDGQYTVFGKILEGNDVLKKFEAAGNPNPYANGSPPLKLIEIKKATVAWQEAKAEENE